MPSSDPTPRSPRRARGRGFVPGKGWLAWIDSRKRRRKPRGEEDPGAIPVSPDRPLDLSGGAAAALDFED